MFSTTIKLIILFFVIFDPLMSLAVFVSATKGMNTPDKRRTAIHGVLVAFAISFAVLLLGQKLLALFSTNLDDLRVGGGIVLGLLGIRMALGQSVTESAATEETSSRAVAAIIGSPLLTGPAAITAIIISAQDHGMIPSGIAIFFVLLVTTFVFLQATRIERIIGKTVIQVFSTILGLISLSWAISFIRDGLGM
jgi:multiple antibiotic resistance protein